MYFFKVMMESSLQQVKKSFKLYSLRKYDLDYMEIGFMEGDGDVEPKVECLGCISQRGFFFFFVVVFIYFYFLHAFGNGI